MRDFLIHSAGFPTTFATSTCFAILKSLNEANIDLRACATSNGASNDQVCINRYNCWSLKVRFEQPCTQNDFMVWESIVFFRNFFSQNKAKQFHAKRIAGWNRSQNAQQHNYMYIIFRLHCSLTNIGLWCMSTEAKQNRKNIMYFKSGRLQNATGL